MTINKKNKHFKWKQYHGSNEFLGNIEYILYFEVLRPANYGVAKNEFFIYKYKKKKISKTYEMTYVICRISCIATDNVYYLQLGTIR